MTLGEKLKEARKQAGLSQEQLFEELGFVVVFVLVVDGR